MVTTKVGTVVGWWAQDEVNQEGWTGWGWRNKEGKIRWCISILVKWFVMRNIQMVELGWQQMRSGFWRLNRD